MRLETSDSLYVQPQKTPFPSLSSAPKKPQIQAAVFLPRCVLAVFLFSQATFLFGTLFIIFCFSSPDAKLMEKAWQ
ncbi:unnamed protein product [Meloidogyne enterolobii]|uniref:Uncharacterized protein n=1 Tax=Meloidogyne enterolobii TaxID=390850 RepID=A0ACB0YKF3_MELEN